MCRTITLFWFKIHDLTFILYKRFQENLSEHKAVGTFTQLSLKKNQWCTFKGLQQMDTRVHSKWIFKNSISTSTNHHQDFHARFFQKSWSWRIGVLTNDSDHGKGLHYLSGFIFDWILRCQIEQLYFWAIIGSFIKATR